MGPKGGAPKGGLEGGGPDGEGGENFALFSFSRSQFRSSFSLSGGSFPVFFLAWGVVSCLVVVVVVGLSGIMSMSAHSEDELAAPNSGADAWEDSRRRRHWDSTSRWTESKKCR